MTAIERVRELLDERGVDYRVSATGYSIDIGPYTTAYANRSDTTLDVSLRQVTPEQAVAATLGAGTCTADETETWECVCDQIGSYGKRVTVHMMECSECGHAYEHVNGDYEFCPRCGRRVVEVDA
jgi:hypothetical protein